MKIVRNIYSDGKRIQLEEECCSEWNSGIKAIHRGLDIAARCGTATHFKMLNFCPWCGARIIHPKPNEQPSRRNVPESSKVTQLSS